MVSANLPFHFPPQDYKWGRAFPQDCVVDWKHRVIMMYMVWGAESLPGRAWWWAVRWCKYILTLASSCFSLLGKNYSGAAISIVNVTTATTWLHPFSVFISNVIFEACGNCAGMQEECTPKQVFICCCLQENRRDCCMCDMKSTEINPWCANSCEGPWLALSSPWNPSLTLWHWHIWALWPSPSPLSLSDRGAQNAGWEHEIPSSMLSPCKLLSGGCLLITGPVP